MALLTGETVDHYRILEPLGSGGMGDVYRAEDLRLRRTVALKTLRADPHDGDATARLLAEARAASALSQPGIAVVYGIGHVRHGADALDYIAMEYVEGVTLDALARERPLDLDSILEIFEQIADALSDAERLGIVHRDLKPANIMVTGAGRVKVLDFGVALRRHPLAAPDDPTLSAETFEAMPGFAGTPQYAAPEQLTGQQVDGRADLFSVGVMLYELVTGQRPFDAPNAAQTLEAMLTREVPAFPRAAADPRLAALEPLVRCLLARDRRDRPAGAGDLRTALASIRKTGRLSGGLQSGSRAVAVAGFVNISGNADDEWLAAGLTETLTAEAAQLGGVSVVPRERMADALRMLRQQTAESDERLYLRAARALGAGWVVNGGFQRSGDTVRVTASLTDAGTGELVRTARVDGGVQAIFELQDRLVRELADALRAAISPTLMPPDTEVASAFEAFSRGLLNRQAESFETLDRAVLLFERAVELDPVYARAHIELGAAYGSKADYLSMPELNTRALKHLRRATELQPGLARGWRELGVSLVALGQVSDGVAALRRALSIEPADASALGAMGRAMFIGYARFRDAAEWFDRALAENANAGWYSLQLAHCAALLREFGRGRTAAQRAVDLQEAFLSGRQGLFIAGGYMRSGHIEALQGHDAEAVELFQRELDFLVRTEHPLRHRIVVELNARMGAAYQRLGDGARAGRLFDVALESFERRVRLGADDPFTRYYAAAIHALRGDAEPALAFLERAVAQQPAFTAARAAIEPEFEGLRADPRFQRAIQAVPR